MLFLFYPWRIETIDLLGGHGSYQLMFQDVREIVQNNKKKYDVLSDILNEAIQFAHDQEDSQDESDSPEDNSDNQDVFDSNLYAAFDPGDTHSSTFILRHWQ